MVVKKVKKERFKLFIWITVLVFFSAIFYNFYYQKEAEYKKKQVELQIVEIERNKLKEENNKLKDKIKYLNTSVGVEEIARNELGFIKEGEVGCVVIDESKNEDGKPSVEQGFWEKFIK